MSRYRVALVGKPIPFHTVILDEMTPEGWQMYTWGGWMRRTPGWITENAQFVDDANAMRLVEELRGRGVEMLREDFELEANNE